MKAILSHIGAWAPMAEQKATAKYLLETANIENYFLEFKGEIELRLNKLYAGIKALKAKGFNVDAVSPQAAIYLTLKLDLGGKSTVEGKILASQADVTQYILSQAKLAIVPFSAFGAEATSPWYRLSVGVVKLEDIEDVLLKLEQALQQLQ
jgi:aspartate aminotransferase